MAAYPDHVHPILMTLLGRLFVLVTVATFPAIAILANNEFGLRRTEWVKATEASRSYAEMLAQEQARVVEAAEQLLLALVQVPAVRRLEADRCHELLQHLQDQFPQYTLIDANDLAGAERCSGRPAPASSIADRPWFKRVVQTDTFAIGDYAVGEYSHRPSIHFAYPIHNDAGAMIGVLAAALDLDWLNRRLAERALPQGASSFIADDSGVVVVGPVEWIGRKLPAHLLELMREKQRGTVDGAGLNTAEHIVSYVPASQAGGFFVGVGLNRDIALSDVRRATVQGTTYVCLGLSLALLSCWFLGQSLIVRPLHALAATISRWETGDRGARTGAAGGGELVAVAQAFDRMAEAVARADGEKAALHDAVAQSEHQFHMLADTMPQLVWIADPNGAIIWYNKRWSEFSGLPMPELQAQGWRRLHHPEHATRVIAHMERCFATGEPWEDTFPLRSNDGCWRWFLGRAEPLRDTGGRVGRWFGTNTDVTDQLEAKAALKAAKEAAEAANAAKSKFLAAASHDLRQPMQSLLLFAAALATQVTDQRARDTVNMIRRSLSTLKALLDALLDVSRLDTGKITPEIRDFELSPLLNEIADGFAPLAANKGLAFKIDIPTALIVHSDPILVGRSVRNLLENAIRYTPEGEVTLACQGKDDVAWIEVRDTGIGIPPDQRQRIFEEFHQVEGVERAEEKGLGLGLAIVQGIARLLRMSIEVDSVPGRGSTFRLGLPLAPAPAAACRTTSD